MSRQEPPWWDEACPDDQRGKRLVEVVNAIDMSPDESMRADLHISHARMFESSPIASLYQFGGRYWSAGGGGGAVYSVFDVNDMSTWNAMRSVCMTAAAIVGRSKPRARFTTSDGNYRQKRRAKLATRFCDGWAQEVDLYAKTYQCLIDSMVFDVGGIQLYEEDGRIKAQRVLANEIRVDPVDGLYGFPRTLYRRRLIGRDVLLAKYGKTDAARSAIETGQAFDIFSSGYHEQSSGLLVAHEAWHLPSTAKANDGRHVLAIEGLNEPLFSEPYTKTYYPIIFTRWEDSRYGFFGRSLASQLAPMQTEVNILLRRIAQAQHLMSCPRVAIQKGSKITKTQLTNGIGSIVEYTTTPPQALSWPAMHPEIYQHLENIINKMYALSGISRDMSSGQKDASVRSGRAIQEALDVQQGRMQVYSQAWERFHVDIYKAMIDMVGDIVSDAGRAYEVAASGRYGMERIDFKQIRMDAKDYTVSVWPVSQLPITPQGKLDFIQDMLKAGLWDIDRAKQAMEDLDVESANSLELAGLRLLERTFEAAIYDGTPCHPDELTPFGPALKLCVQHINVGREEGVPAKHIDLLLRYLEELKALQPAPAPVPAPAPAAPLSPLGPAFAPTGMDQLATDQLAT